MMGMAVAAAAVTAALSGAAPAPLEPLPPDHHLEGCTVPLGAALPPCDRTAPRTPRPTDCVLPVTPPPGAVVPDCSPGDPFPRGRVIPVGPGYSVSEE